MVTKFTSLVYVCLIGMFTFGSASSFAITSGCPDTDAYPLNGCSLPGNGRRQLPVFLPECQRHL